MVKRVLCAMAVVAMLIPFFGGSVVAQQTPKPTIRDYVQVPPSPAVMKSGAPKMLITHPKPPAYCNPCLFYGGDFDASNLYADGLSNENDELVPGAEVLVPFTIPRAQLWFVTGLFTNVQASVDVIDPKQATWSISKGVTEGSGGRTIAQGTAHASFEPTGRLAFGYFEYTVLVRTPVLLLGPGTYWLTVVPQCTNSADSACGVARYFLSNTEDDPPLNYYGPLEPYDLSYFNSPYYGFTYDNANEVITGFDRFSAGVLGF